MPHRVIGLWVALVGLLGVILVVLFVMFGGDARRASATGPRWKRKLLTTGLMLLTAAGVVGCDKNAAPAAGRTSIVQDAALETLLKDPRWLAYRKAWSHAEDIALGRIKAMPIYSDEMPAEIEAIAKAETNLGSLAQSGLIADVEHRYLKCELSILIESLNRARTYPIVLKQLASPKASLARTIKRMGALKGLASTKTVSVEAWNMISPEITNDLRVLVIAMGLGGSGQKPVDENVEIFYEACKYVRKISKRAKDTDLKRDKAWEEFVQDRWAVGGIFEYLGVSRLLGHGGRGAKELGSIQSQLVAFKRAGRLSEHMVALFEIEHAVSRDILLPAADRLKAKSDDSKPNDLKSAAVRRMMLRKNALSALAKSPQIRPMVVRDTLAIAQADYDALSGQVKAYGDNVKLDRKDARSEADMLASIEIDILALRKRITSCDRGGSDLRRRYQWVRLREIWRRCEHVWEIHHGGYPFNARGRLYALSLILEAYRHVESLEAADMLDPAEARILNSEFKKIWVGMETMRSTDDYGAMCYSEHGGVRSGSETLDEVMKRLALLEKIQAAGKLHPRVLAAVLYGMERTIPVPPTQEEWDRDGSGSMFYKDSQTYPGASVAGRIDRLKKAHQAWRSRLPGDSRRIEILGALRFATKVVRADDQTCQDRKTVWVRLCKANLLVRELLSSGMLTRDDAVLMSHGINSFWDIIARRPLDAVQRRLRTPNMSWTWDSRDDLVGAGIYPGYQNLGHWLDILSKASDSGKVSPIVHKEVLQQLKVIWPCRRELLLQEHEEWESREMWETDYFDTDDDSPSTGLFDLDPEDIQFGDDRQQGDK